jgi:hypothetical protein
MPILPQLKEHVVDAAEVHLRSSPSAPAADDRHNGPASKARWESFWRLPAGVFAAAASLLVVAGVVAVIIVQAPHIGHNPGTGGARPGGGARGRSQQTDAQGAITPAASINQAVIDVLMPISGAAWDSGLSAVQDFTAALRTTIVNRCLAAMQLPKAPQSLALPLAGTDLLPDLTALRVRGQFDVLLHTTTGPSARMSSTERAAYTRAVTRCSAQVPEQTPSRLLVARTGGLRAVRRATNRLNIEWINIVTAVIDSSRQVDRANHASARCSRTTPFPAQNYQDALTEISNAFGPYYQEHQDANGDAVNRRAAAVFLRCFGPAITAVQRELAARRPAFLAHNSGAVRAIQREAASEVTTLETKYGVQFGR